MRRDAIYYQIFKRFPDLFFMLLDDPPISTQSYRFDSIEIKETSFRIDGVFLPPKNAENKIVYFCEVQFQKDDSLYARFFAELFLSIYRNLNSYDDWFGLLIFPSRRLIPKNKAMFQDLIDSNRVKEVFIDELNGANDDSIGVKLMQLPTLPQNEIVKRAKELIEEIKSEEDTALQKQAIIDIISTIAVYKFDKLKRGEVEEMLGLNLDDTKIYKDAVEEGKLTEAVALILRQLSRRIGNVSPDLESQIKSLPLAKIEDLGEALLDFSEPADLVAWLQKY